MEKEFVILKVSWLTKHYRTEKDRSDFIGMHFYLAKFLQDNNLTLRKLVTDIKDVDDDFEIHSADISSEGMVFLRKFLENWMDKIDRGMSPTKIDYLTKGLKKIREK